MSCSLLYMPCCGLVQKITAGIVRETHFQASHINVNICLWSIWHSPTCAVMQLMVSHHLFMDSWQHICICPLCPLNLTIWKCLLDLPDALQTNLSLLSRLYAKTRPSCLKACRWIVVLLSLFNAQLEILLTTPCTLGGALSDVQRFLAMRCAETFFTIYS